MSAPTPAGPPATPPPAMSKAAPAATVRRRPVLAALAVALAGTAAGCRDRAGTPTAAPTTQAGPPAPDPLLVDLAAERRLLGSYDATTRRHPALAHRLAPLRADHAAHVAALARELGPAAGSPTPSAGPTGSGSTPTSRPPGGDGVPGTPAAAVGALLRAERAAAAARTVSCLSAPVARAALLASIAACEASHQVVLT